MDQVDTHGGHPGLFRALCGLISDGERLILLVVVRLLFLDSVIVVYDHGYSVFLGF